MTSNLCRWDAVSASWGKRCRRTVGAAAALLAVAALSAPTTTRAGESQEAGEPRALVPTRISRAPVIDGRLDDSEWRKATVVTGFFVPDSGRSPDQRTEVRVLADARTVYVAFTCDGAPVRSGDAGVLALRDHVTVEFDPEGNRTYRTFSVSADSAQFENGVSGVTSSERWQGAAEATESGWTAELAIPVGQATSNSQAVALGVNFIRYHPVTHEWSRWAERSIDWRPDDVAWLVLRDDVWRGQSRSFVASLATPEAVVAQNRPAATSTDRWAVPALPFGATPTPSRFDPPRRSAAGGMVGRAAGSTMLPGGYLVQLGDVLEIKHFHNPELNELLPVRPDGRISLELVGEVQAAGLPVADLQAILLQRYATYVRQPEVAVIVKEFGGNRVYVAGEVNEPGVLTTNGHLTVLQAIFEAGGYKRSAELRSVVVLRNQGTATPLFMTIDLKDSLTKPGKHVNDTPLRPYDIVFVPQTRVSRMGDLVQQYVDDLIPLPVTLGLSYLFRQ